MSRPPDTTGSAAITFRAELEGLRAIAVVLVVLFHARIGPFRGGFVGVDVFFVVSGYLITSLLWREVESTGRVGLGAFWARRARRLLPASILVIVATLVAGRIILDPLTQRDIEVDAFGATFFAANFVFAFLRSGYFASQRLPSPLLHYWSLALEEQFYLLWPLLFAGIARLAGAARRQAARIVIGAIIVTSLAASLAFSDRTDWAFYLLPTRAWELAAGALLAFGTPAIRRLPKLVRTGIGWAALIAIVAIAMTFDESLPFPGIAAAAPVAATMALIAVGDARRNVGPSRLLATTPMMWVGARSYAIYLWHWPLLVLAAAHRGADLPAVTRAGLAGASVVLGALSCRFVENPIRYHRALTGSVRSSLVLGGALLAISAVAVDLSFGFSRQLSGGGSVAAAPSFAGASTIPATAPILSATTGAPPATVPPDASVTGSLLPGVEALRVANYPALAEALQITLVPANLDPALSNTRADEPAVYGDGCHLAVAELKPRDCVYGDKASSTDVLLFGDSHAAQWFPAMERVAVAHGWRLHVMTKSGCPTAAIPQGNAGRDDRCNTWRDNVTKWIVGHQPELVVMSARAYDYLRHDVWAEALTGLLADIRPAVGQVLMLGDTPDQGVDVAACLSEHLASVPDCLTPRADSINEHVMRAERTLAERHDVLAEPTTNWVCTLDGCPVIVGNVLMYRDDNHLTTTAVLALQPYLDAVLTHAVAMAG